jgi:DNA-binding LacI/PurR family transcriptional regulator
MRKKDKRANTRAHVSRETIVSGLRKRIVAGELAPGDRMPAHVAIQREFGAARLTVERAMAQLQADGFVRGVAPIGTFVTDRPPHLTRYAIVFTGSPANEPPGSWSRFDEAIARASASVAAERGISFAHYYNVRGYTDCEGYQSLLRDVENQRLAGIIFKDTPFELQGTPLLERNDPPRVIPAQNAEIPSPGRMYDYKRFMYRALDAFETRGRRRIAVLTLSHFAWGFPDEFLAAVESRGMIIHPFWMQAVDPHRTFWVRHAVHAILSAHARELPDALLVTDDHLVEPVAEALAEFGVRVPQQIHVIGHWNFPLIYRGQAPIDLLGFDARELLRLQVDTIDAQRRGERVVDFATVPARLAWELAPETETNQNCAAGKPAEIHSI